MVTFQGIPSGDGECFCWKSVPEEDMKKILGEEEYKSRLDLENEFRREENLPEIHAFQTLYPDDLVRDLSNQQSYKFQFDVQIP